MAHDVFISYSSKDKLIADAICSNLENAGIRCWIAPRDIEPGDDWPTAISMAIKASKIMVLIFSTNSNHSKDVGRELILAANNNLIIVPFKIDNTEPEPGKQYYLARTHWLDAMNPPTQEQINKLVKLVKGFLGNLGVEPVQTSSTEESSEKKDKTVHGEGFKRKRVWIPIVTISIIALVISGLLFIPGSPMALAERSLNPTSTLTQSASPTSNSAQVPTSTATTSPTVTAEPTENPETSMPLKSDPPWVAEFAEPILALTGNNNRTGDLSFEYGNPETPTIMDFDCTADQLSYNSDDITLSNCDMSWKLWVTDFVVSMDFRIDPTGDNQNNQWTFFFRGNNSYTFDYFGNVEVTFPSSTNSEIIEIPESIWHAGNINHIVIIVSDYETALFVNNTPIYDGEMSEEWKNGDAQWWVTGGIVTFDQIDIWDINSLQ